MKKKDNVKAKIITREFVRSFFCLGTSKEDDKQLDKIYSKLVRIQYANGENICEIDGEPDGMFFLESGTAVVLNRDGDQINVMQEGQYFGEYAVLARAKRLSTVQSLGRTAVYKLSAADMNRILADNPDIYGEFMKRVYGQLSKKHTKILEFNRAKRRSFVVSGETKPMSMKKTIWFYSMVTLVLLLLGVLSVYIEGSFLSLIPVAALILYVLLTRRMIEAIVVACMAASILAFRQNFIVGLADTCVETVGNLDEGSTIIIMALMGSVVTLVRASGAVTAFKKLASQRINSKKGARFGLLGSMALTAIDEDLCVQCGMDSFSEISDEMKITHEENALVISLLPTVLCSFVPFSIWGIFVIGTMGASVDTTNFSLFCKAIPYNFFSLLTVFLFVLYGFGVMPRSKQIKSAIKRVERGGHLWPEGSDEYLEHDEIKVWGQIRNLLIPIVTLAISTLLVRSISERSFAADSACGLIVTLVVMFFLYCGQKLMTPEEYMEGAVSGLKSSIEPIFIYILIEFFFELLVPLGIEEVYDSIMAAALPVQQLAPAILFLVSLIFTVAIGTSWGMFAMAFPIAMSLASLAGVSLPLCIGAVCAAGIAGEQCCVLTGEHVEVAQACGINPKAALNVRIPYTLGITLASFFLYLIIGFIA